MPAKDGKKEVFVMVRMTKAERQAFEPLARKLGMKLPAWFRYLGNRETSATVLSSFKTPKGKAAAA